MWNYRVVQYDVDCMGIVEAYYNKRGEICGFTVNPIIVADSVAELYEILNRMKLDLDKNQPLLDPDSPLAPWDEAE